MYDFVRGVVASHREDEVVLDTGGVGYLLHVSASTRRRVPSNGEMTLYTHLLVRDERMDLFGFASRGERHLFRQLLSVAGVGPAVALGLLSAYEPETLASHIAAAELGALTKVKGIGKRTGERILVELRDRVEAAPGPARPQLVGSRQDAVLALCALGLPRAEAEARVSAVPEGDFVVEEVVKLALKRP